MHSRTAQKSRHINAFSDKIIAKLFRKLIDSQNKSIAIITNRKLPCVALNTTQGFHIICNLPFANGHTINSNITNNTVQDHIQSSYAVFTIYTNTMICTAHQTERLFRY